MKHLLTTSLLALLLTVAAGRDKNSTVSEPDQPPEALRGIVSGIHMEMEDRGKVLKGDFSIEYDENGNITKFGAPAEWENGSIFYYKRQGDKLIVTHTWSDSPQELTDETLEATLDDKGRAVTAKRTWTKDFGDEPNVDNLLFHYSDNGEIKDDSSDYIETKSEYTWRDGNIIGHKMFSERFCIAKQLSSHYENRTNLDFTDVFSTILDYPFGMMYTFNGLLRSSGHLGNMDKNLPKEVKWTFHDIENYTDISYRYVFDDKGRPKRIFVVFYDGRGRKVANDGYTATITLTISYKN